MDSYKVIDKLISRLLFLGLGFSLIFVYFAQERLYRTETFGILTLGPERYLRIASVLFIIATVILAIFRGKSKYTTKIYLAYITLFLYIFCNFLLTADDIFDTTLIMDTKGWGPWICMGLIFVSYNDKLFKKFNRFLLLSAIVIFLLTVYNLVDYGIGLYRGQALAKYRVYAVNMMWITPYVYLILKQNAKLARYRILVLLAGISLAIITQTRSFLLIYFLVIAFDFYYARKKTIYIVGGAVMVILFLLVVFSTEGLSTSYTLLSERGLQDTRSGQLVQFYEQMDFFETIVGKGSNATWSFYGNRFAYLDNQWIYLLWWAGLIPFLMYFYLTAYIPTKMFFKAWDYETKVEAFILVLWSLACAGLAIYSTMSVDFFFFVICIIQGRLLYKYSMAR